MDPNNIVCPVCTLYLRPGITLKSHLSSHPKQKIIEALVNLSDTSQKLESFTGDNGETSSSGNDTSHGGIVANNVCGVENLAHAPSPANVSGVQGNHVFIYQQSMSATGSQSNVLNVNPLSQQYVIPTVFNSQMMPYVYQQQQVIMSSGACVPPQIRALPFGIPNTSEEASSSPGQTCIITEAPEDNVLSPASIHSQVCQSVDVNKVTESNNDEETLDEKEVVIHKNELEKPIKIDDSLVATEELDAEFNSSSIEEYNDNEQECLTSPSSNHSDWSVKIRTDLNKACQTHNSTNLSPRSFVQDDEEILDNIDNVENMETVEPEYYFPGETEIQPHTTTVTTMDGHAYNHTDNIYSTSNILQPGDNLDFVEMDGMHVIINGFSSNHIISQVENFDNTKPERPGVLMTIGGMVDVSREMSDREESYSHDGANVDIRADEPMPARGELSGQESMGGASDITWNRIHYNELNSTVSSSYDLMAHESWEASNGSDVNGSVLQTQPLGQDTYLHGGQNIDMDEDVPAIVGFSGPPLNFKCSSCGEAFVCLQDRKDHELEKHPEKKPNIIGSEIGKKKVKKLIIKTKQDKNETENNFDNVFTNKLKLEPPVDIENKEIMPSTNEITPDMKDEGASATIEIKVMCSICNEALSDIRALKAHKAEVHNVAADIRHKCATCGEAFPNDYKYTEHLKVHPLECRLCGKLFYRRQNLQLHMKRHLGIKPYKCEICEKSFLTKQKHDEHRNVHTGENPIKCTMCEETFKRHSNLVQHRNRHHLNFKRKIRDYICFCGEIFHSKKKLAWHKETHDPKPKACTQCSERFIHMASLTRHMRRAHNKHFLPKEERNQENVECDICHGVYLRSSLAVHRRSHNNQKPYTCAVCNKSFTTKWNLKLHKWTHASRTSKPYKCEMCKGAFIRETDYVAHMNSHKSVRPYTCNYCGAQFIRKYNCQRHVKEHENHKMFNCNICGKSFHRSYYLKDHKRIHTQDRPYSCHVCGKTSATKSNHNKHVQIHHAREPVNTEH